MKNPNFVLRTTKRFSQMSVESLKMELKLRTKTAKTPRQILMLDTLKRVLLAKGVRQSDVTKIVNAVKKA